MEIKKCPNCKCEKQLDEFSFKKTESRHSSWCKECTYNKQKKRWSDRKIKAIHLMGGKCSKCGYDKNYAALEFHHLKPSEKEYSWKNLKCRKWSEVILELKKCVLLCRNCHSETHHPQLLKDKLDFDNLEDNNYLDLSSISPTGICPHCEASVYRTTYCSVACRSASKRKVERPSLEELKELIDKKSFCAIGRQYNVSDNAVRKWAKFYGLIK